MVMQHSPARIARGGGSLVVNLDGSITAVGPISQTINGNVNTVPLTLNYNATSQAIHIIAGSGSGTTPSGTQRQGGSINIEDYGDNSPTLVINKYARTVSAGQSIITINSYIPDLSTGYTNFITLGVPLIGPNAIWEVTDTGHLNYGDGVHLYDLQLYRPPTVPGQLTLVNVNESDNTSNTGLAAFQLLHYKATNIANAVFTSVINNEAGPGAGGARFRFGGYGQIQWGNGNSDATTLDTSLVRAFAGGLLLQTNAQTGQGVAVHNITAISVANPTVVTSVAHGLSSTNTIPIVGSDSTPSIDGNRVVTVIDADTFTIPVNVTVAGQGGSFSRWTGSGSGRGNPALTITPGNYNNVTAISTSGLLVSGPTLTINATYAELANARFAVPTFNNGAQQLTDIATVIIDGAPIGTVAHTHTPTAIWVKGGDAAMRFGAFHAIAAEVLNGYVTLQTDDGTIRKLATIA